MTVTDIPVFMPRTGKRGPAKVINPDIVPVWESYFDEGLSAKHIAEIFGVSAPAVRRHCPGRGWSAQQRLEHSLAVKALARI